MAQFDQLRQYLDLIEAIIRSSNPDPFDPRKPTVNERPVYRPLRICHQLQIMLQTQSADRKILTEINRLDDHPMSARAFHLAGELFDDRDLIERSRRIFDRLISNQQPSGEFLPLDSNANLESRWYEELILLHAVAGYCAAALNEPCALAVQKSAEFHLNETQPDHATSEPWGLLAFIQYAPAMADQLLHAMTMHNPQGITGIPLLLLCDVLYGLKQLTMETDR